LTGWAAGLAISAVGLALIGWTLWDIFQTVVLPRPAPGRWRLSRILTRVAWPSWRWRALRRTTSVDRERILGSYAPAVVLAVLAAWMLAMIVGFGLLMYALRDGITPVPDIGSAIYFAGTSVVTLGFGDLAATQGLTRALTVLAGGLGLGALALGITYLFSLYASFQRREILIVRLEARSGAPPSGVALLETYAAPQLRDNLAGFFSEWETWAAEVLDSHVAYPILPYFRSSHDDISWLSALGAVLDAAALVLTLLPEGPRGEAMLVQRVGGHFVEDLANFFGWPDRALTLVEPMEFEDARERLAAAGWTVDRSDAAWPAFAALRSAYAARLNEMALYWVTPPAMWIGDRGAVRHAPGAQPG
jgi:hypothetical protein